MTAYKDFHQDFPTRCLSLLRMAEEKAHGRNLEVTLIIMVASAGLVIPFERLRPRKIQHPIGDREKYSDASSKLDELLTDQFFSSQLQRGTNIWEGGRVKSIDTLPDEWPEMKNTKEISKEKTVGGVIKIIRNALAHGNIFTHGDPIISRLIFAEKHENNRGEIKDFPYVSVTPDDFTIFIKSWFNFLQREKISSAEAYESISRAA